MSNTLLNRSTLTQSGNRTFSETFGAKLRRLARQAKGTHSWTKPYMKSVAPWQPSQAVIIRDVRVNGGNLYVCSQAGTTASTGGPTGTVGTAVTDGTAKWYYFGANLVTQDPATSTPAWVASTAYSLGNLVTNGGNVYACVVAGTSAGSGGPTTTSNAITDNTATWTYLGATFTNPYVSDFPTYTYSASAAPSGQTNIYLAGTGSNFTALAQCSVIAGGTGYVVGDVITLTGGTFTTAVQVTVTAVNAGVVTAVSVTRAGAYTTLPTSLPVAQGSTTGIGTGATFYIHFSQPGWCRIRGGDPTRHQNGVWLNWNCVQAAAGANETWNTGAMEFMSDAPTVTFRLSTVSTAAASICIVVDGVRWNLQPLDLAAAGSNNNFYSLAFPSGRKIRHWRLEADMPIGFAMPSIYVDANSQVWAPDDTDKIMAAIVGDSLIVSAAPGPYVTGNCVTLGLSRELGWADCRNVAIGTTGWVHQNPANTGGNAFPYRAKQMIAAKPDIWVLAGSWNDLAETPSAVTAAVTDFITTVRASGSKAPLVFVGIWSANGGTSAMTATEAAVQAGIVDPLGLSFWIPVFGDPYLPWLTGTWNNNPAPSGITLTTSTNQGLYLDSANAPHPPDIGIVYWYRRIADAIRKNVLPNLP